MKLCGNCHVYLRESQTQCPFCHEPIIGTYDLEEKIYPSYDMKKLSESSRLMPKLVAFLALLVSGGSLFINLITWDQVGKWWSVFVIGIALYLWLLVGNTICSKMHGGGKIILQTIGLSLLAVLIDFNSGFHRWSVNLVVPFIVIAATQMITIIVFSKKMLWNAYIGYAITMIFLSFLPILLFVFGIATSFWACALSGLYALITLGAMFLFSEKDFKNQFISRFHF